MAIVPDLQVLYRRKDDILFGWKPLKKSEAKHYNLYTSASSGGVFTLLKSKIPNEVDRTIYRGKVVTYVKNSDVPIPDNKFIPPDEGGVVIGVDYWFKLTFVDLSDTESVLASSPAIVVRPPNVEPLFEGENEVQNAHLMCWIEERHRWEKVICTDDGKLKVDASVNIDNITLGNVKIAAESDNTTLQFLLVDGQRRLVVCQDPNCFSRIDDYEEKLNVVKNVETIILTFSNATAYFVEKVVCSGTSDAKFRLKIDGSVQQTLRNSWNDRNVKFDFSTKAKKVTGTSTVTVTAEHDEVNNQDFEANLDGFTF